jgi:hypothetical protein
MIGNFTSHTRNNDHAAYNDSHAMFASSSTLVHGRRRPRRNHVVSHAPRRMCNGPSTVYHDCNTSFVLSCKNAKVVAGIQMQGRQDLYLGSKSYCD